MQLPVELMQATELFSTMVCDCEWVMVRGGLTAAVRAKLTVTVPPAGTVAVVCDAFQPCCVALMVLLPASTW